MFHAGVEAEGNTRGICKVGSRHTSYRYPIYCIYQLLGGGIVGKKVLLPDTVGIAKLVGTIGGSTRSVFSHIANDGTNTGSTYAVIRFVVSPLVGDRVC